MPKHTPLRPRKLPHGCLTPHRCGGHATAAMVTAQAGLRPPPETTCFGPGVLLLVELIQALHGVRVGAHSRTVELLAGDASSFMHESPREHTVIIPHAAPARSVCLRE